MPTFPEKLLFGLIVLGAAAYFVWRIVWLVRLLRTSEPDPDERVSHPGRRIGTVLLDVFLQRKVLRKPFVGLLHLLIVWGFFVFAVNTLNHFTAAFIPGFNVLGSTRPALYYATAADVFAAFVLVGVVGLAFRRHVLRPESLTRPSPESAVVFASIGGAMAAYLFWHAGEIALGMLDHPQYHVVGALLAKGLSHLDPRSLLVAAHVAWWCEGLTHLLLIALLFIPTKHLHLLAGPINLALARTRPRGQLVTMDLENPETERFGVSKIRDFTWKQNLDLYACIECGRCQDFCPTHLSGKALNPKRLVKALRHHLLEHAPRVPMRERAVVPQLIGDTVSTEAVWDCTTCLACVEHCPMGIEHVDKLVAMRRHLVLMEARFPKEADAAFRNMENAGNPWGLARAERAAWARGLDVPLLAEKRKAEVLYWVGCSGSYDDGCRKIAVAMVRILKKAGVDFAILGPEERCTCESARRLGNEYLYQMVTQEIIETFKRYTFDRILTTCPHCFNTFANEYPAFGAEYVVCHHTTFIQELIRSGRLPLRGEAGGPCVPAGEMVLHDSCYLARYNEISDAPRQVLEAAGQTIRAAARERKRAICCGAGGGRMWLEETAGERIGSMRAHELIGSGAPTVATACPFCKTMLTDGAKSHGSAGIAVRDIAEIVADALEE